ncbi:MAG: hypothetical protein ABSE51_20870 [Terracidiphilus sp.]|jgi:hypothetical protein
MTEHSVVLLVCLAAIAALAILIYVAGRVYAACRTYLAGCGQTAVITAAYELRQTLDQILANTLLIDKSLHG